MKLKNNFICKFDYWFFSFIFFILNKNKIYIIKKLFIKQSVFIVLLIFYIGISIWFIISCSNMNDKLMFISSILTIPILFIALWIFLKQKDSSDKFQKETKEEFKKINKNKKRELKMNFNAYNENWEIMLEFLNKTNPKK